MSSDLSMACEELGTWLAIAETLIALEDVEPSTRMAGKPTSRPPWNAAVAYAITDAHAGVRTLEREFRIEISGKARSRGGSNGNTTRAIEAIAAMEQAVPEDHAKRAARLLIRWADAIRQLPAVDDKPRWEKIRAGPDGLPPRCPYCQTFSLRVQIESGAISCWFPGCTDTDGKRPYARLDINKLDGTPVLVWREDWLWTPCSRSTNSPAGSTRPSLSPSCAASSTPSASKPKAPATQAKQADPHIVTEHPTS